MEQTSLLDGAIMPPIHETRIIREYVMQCFKCLHKWPMGTHLRKDGEQRTTCPECGARGANFTRLNPTTIQVRDDLLMLTGDQYPERYCPSTSLEEIQAASIDRFIVDRVGNAKLFISRGWEPLYHGHYAYLSEGGVMWMTSDKDERDSMLWAVVDKCPDHARVFVAGLGLGIVLLYLAKSGKSVEVIVAEKSENIIELIEPKIRPWLQGRFPHFKWTVIHGDALELVASTGSFDWIFFDIWMGSILRGNAITVEETRRASIPHLAPVGVFTAWPDILEEHGIR